MALKYDRTIKELSPVSCIKKFSIFNTTEQLEFQCSKYVNGEPGSGITFSRKISKITNFDLLYRCINREFNKLKHNEEFALHSIVHKNGKTLHLPMIDFSTLSENELFDHLSFLQDEFNYDIYIFSSGRSFHAYIDTLLDIDHWHNFLSKLLLMNKNDCVVTDARWIAHSIRQRYSSLRLSCNTTVYYDYPKFIGILKRKGQ